ncbi:MAG: hypothetical protein JSW08_01485 [archaeon]|nr:MAG: hypothetical protein JSW08_01485 [archaeon]
MDWRKVIKEETENSGITMFPSASKKKKWYPYVILPFECRMSARFQKASILALKKLLKNCLKEATCILLPEAKAFLLAPFAMAINKDIVLLRKRDYHVKGQFKIKQAKAYLEKKKGEVLYCLGLQPGDRPILIDDVLSSGKTSIGIIKEAHKRGIRFAGVSAFYERGDGIDNVRRETNYKAKAVARLEIIDERPRCLLHDL